MFRLFISLILFAGIFSSCNKKEKNNHVQAQPRPVRVIQVEALGNITKHYTGTVEAQEFSILAFKIPGTLNNLPVQKGEFVKKGQIIAGVKNYDFEKQYETAAGNYKAAESIYRRTKNLYVANAVAKQSLEIAEADYIRAEAALNIAKRTLQYTNLHAPFNGFVEKRFVENYEEVLPGQAVVRLVNPKNIKVRFTLPENNTRLLELPKKIYVEFDSQQGVLFSSDIKEYVYASDGSGIPVTLHITDEAFTPYRQNIFPGFSCKVTFNIDNMIADKFIIPSSALFSQNNKQFVWVIHPESSTIKKREVDIIQYQNLSLVQSGLNRDDLIVIAGVASVQEGQVVKPEKTALSF